MNPTIVTRSDTAPYNGLMYTWPGNSRMDEPTVKTFLEILGDRADVINRAVALLRERVACRKFAVSALVESEPWGFESPNFFLNAGVTFVSDIAPLALLDVCQAIERELGSALHRDAQGVYVDRIVDIDVIAAGDMILHTRRLTLPHPLMHRREFVLRPMAELMPEWRHPVLRQTAGEMLSSL